ncbi:hypothetical protein JTB14_011955 [Gonioctena quinquepunctata]|nr:hypothetical protein JTB14_011955 [Gonioctena quinquepunctata]
MVRDSVEDPTEPKFSPAYLSENKNFSDLAGELAKDEVNHFNNEDHSECDDDPLTNNVGSKTKTVKTENYFDVIYDDVKPEIYDGKTENGSYPNVPHELSKDSETWPQQNIEECGTALDEEQVLITPTK